MHRENLIRTLHRFATSPGADVHEWDNNNQQFRGGGKHGTFRAGRGKGQ
jgi:hypothetical protein